MSSSPSPNGSPGSPSQLLGSREVSNATLILRLIRLGLRYRTRAAKSILIQIVLLSMALGGLGFTGLGIDVIRSTFTETAQPPQWPLGLNPPSEWPPMLQVAIIAALVLTIAFLRFWFDRAATMWKAELVWDVLNDLRGAVYEKLQRLSFRFYDANESSSIINRVTGDVQAVRMFIDGVLIEVLMLLLSLTFFLIYMLRIHVWLTIVCLATTPLLYALTHYFAKIVKPAYRKNRELFDRTVLVLSENAQGVHVVKGFCRQDAEIAKFRKANQDVTDQKRWIFRRVSVFSPAIGFIPQINLAVLLLYGGWLVIRHESGRGEGIALGTGLFVFAGLLQQFSNQVANIAQIANTVQQSLTGAQRVFEVLDQPLDVQSPPNPKPLKRAKGLVEFEHVSFAYRNVAEPVLHDVNLRVEPGQTVAILGATGAGKTTLLSLIPRFYDPSLGRVRIDGVDLREYDLDALRRNIGMVFQESFLFSNTVAANIAFGHPDASREQIEKAAKIAAAHDFITQLPKGYDTVLTEGGANLSGGQRQRLAIARAVLLEPPILLLDDPTAAIDPETEHEILLAMDQAMQGRTTFVIAHRLSTLRRADRVIVLDRGRIVQQGTHEELMGQAGHYRWAASIQAADAESRRLLGLPDEATGAAVGVEAGTL